MRIFIFLLSCIFVWSCDNDSIIKKNCIKKYFPTGELQEILCVLSNSDTLSRSVFYPSGKLYSEGLVVSGMNDGLTTYYYENGNVKAINLHKMDSLYYIKSYDAVTSDSTDKIIPIISQLSELKEQDVSFRFSIPFTKQFPYSKDKITIHYSFVEDIQDSIYSLPKDNFVLSGKDTVLYFTPKNVGNYKFMGLITLNDEVLDKANNHFFRRKFIVE